MKARQREVAGNRQTIVLLGDDVINLKGGRVEDLGHQTVFASVPSSTPNQLNKRLIHEYLSLT
jgi:hypothetical protein